MSEAVIKSDIAVDVDGSDKFFAALKWALEEALLTDQSISAVFGWTHSWGMRSEPGSDEAWTKVRYDIAGELRVWVDKAAAGIDFDPANLKLTSVKVSDTSALLQIGHDSQQIVAGRRSLSRTACWFMGSLSASLAEATEVPVIVVRITGDEDETVTEVIANALTPRDKPVHHIQPRPVVEGARRPVIVGVDGSETSHRVFDSVLEEARLYDASLRVVFYWQLKDLGVIPGYEDAVVSVKVGQHHAEGIPSELMAKVRTPDGIKVNTDAFHIPASKGLIVVSRYASRLVVGSYGLSGLDTHFLGPVSRQIVDFAEYTVTAVH